MNLPHKKPILFANKVLQKDENSAKVECVFPSIPTLGMSIEASAQASAALASGEIDGFLAGVNSVELLKELDKKTYVADIKKVYEIDNMELFSFELEDYVKGKFAIYAN